MDSSSAAWTRGLRRWTWSLAHNGPRWTLRHVKVFGGLPVRLAGSHRYLQPLAPEHPCEPEGCRVTSAAKFDFFGTFLRTVNRGRSEEDKLREALSMTLRALEHHDFWCGYNRDAPGDGIYNAAVRAAKEALGVH